ncbi:AsnC family transcriptional regulator [Chromatiales bacterium (ex Bugula neritina AB1)]|nr:AsnC family transcriptional regulator [Chromatiales bacterium (ex Bugula neritina AB1)]
MLALQRDASLTNNALSGLVNLSPSQCSRRRQALEDSGVIVAYRAELDADQLGFGIEALTRVTLATHNASTSDEFSGFLASLSEVVEAQAVTGDADYVLRLRVRSLDELADFIHRQLLPHAAVAQVKSDIVLKTVKPYIGLQPVASR